MSVKGEGVQNSSKFCQCSLWMPPYWLTVFSNVSSTNNWRGWISRTWNREKVILTLSHCIWICISIFTLYSIDCLGFRGFLWLFQCCLIIYLLELPIVAVLIDGPSITKFMKSNLKWKIFKNLNFHVWNYWKCTLFGKFLDQIYKSLHHSHQLIHLCFQNKSYSTK